MGGRSASALLERSTAKGAVASPEECPPKVILKDKGYCQDAATHKLVEMECCRSILDCRDTITNLQPTYSSVFEGLVRDCALSQADLGEHANNSSQVCEPACLDAVAALPPLPDIDAFQRKCSASLDTWDAQALEEVVALQQMVSKVLTAADACAAAAACAALDNCNRDSKWGRPRGECNWRHIPNTKVRFASCSCYPHFTGERCQTRIPGLKCSKTKKNSCTIHPIDWYQDDCSIHGALWKYESWEHCRVDLRKHKIDAAPIGGRYICRKDYTCHPKTVGHDCCSDS